MSSNCSRRARTHDPLRARLDNNVGWFPQRHIFEAHPVYHRRLDWDSRVVDYDTVELRTRCGIVTDRWNSLTGEKFVDRGMAMRRDYADLFGRPCRRCFLS